MFPLYRICAEDCDNTKECTHENEEDRALAYTWVSIQLFAALERGYRLLDVYEVWHFPETTQYDKITGAGRIFAKSTIGYHLLWHTVKLAMSARLCLL